MSVSEMNLSWSTLSGRQSIKSKGSSVFLTSEKRTGSQGNRTIIRPHCVSAKIRGMRFQSWREPKPLRSRCGSAVQSTSNDEEGEKQQPTKGKAPKSPRKQTHPSEEEENDVVKDVVDRLSQHTLASRHKSSRARPREAGVDMNWYSWSKMNVYKDYQGVIYKDNGALRPKSLGKAR